MDLANTGVWSALDALSADEAVAFAKRVEALRREGQTVVLVTHDDVIGRAGDRLVRIEDGIVASDERLR